jgi:site-specific DNA-methyltransferase (adenine-specific)
VRKLKIEYVKVDVPIPWPGNPKEHDMRAIVNSVEEFDVTQPILIQKGTNRIIAGHGRLEAFKAAGHKEVPVIVLDMTDKQAKAYTIIDNQTVMAGGWNMPKLEAVLGELKVELPDLDMTDFGFEAGETGVEEDEVPEPKKTSDTKRGTIVQLGKHRVMCGDCTDPADVAKLMDGKKADMVFTDPPYSVGIGGKNRSLQAMNKAGRVTTDLEGDNETVEETAGALWKPAFTLMGEQLRDGGSYYITAPQGGDHMMMMMMMMMKGSVPCKHELIWVKNQPAFSMGRLDYDYKHEPILYGWKGNHKFVGGGQFTKSVWLIDRERKCDLHPTMKPVALVSNAVLNSTDTGNIVLDPFGGSGTTLIACEQLGRTAYLMEIDGVYFDVICARYKAYKEAHAATK